VLKAVLVVLACGGGQEQPDDPHGFVLGQMESHTVAAVLSRAGRAQLLDVAIRRGWIHPGTARAMKIAGVPVLALSALVWLVVSVLRAGGSGPPPVYAEFVDPSSSSYLDVQLDRSTMSYGAFSAVVPGEGRVWPAARVEARQRNPRVVELHYEGVGYRDPQVQPGGPPADPPQRWRKPQVVHLRLVGQVDAAGHIASVDVWVNGDRHHIGSTGEVRGAEAVVDDFLVALRTSDWDKLYGIEAAYTRNGIRRNDFVTQMANAGAVTCISGAETIGSTTYRTTAAGASYARTPIRLTYGTCAATARVEAALVLVVDGGTWKVLAVE
jgi:hypothetical protein